MSLDTTMQLADDRALDARRRSFAWHVVAGKRREQLGRDLGLSAAQVHGLLASPGMALLVWVWRGFWLHRREGGLRQLFQAISFLLREALAADRAGPRPGLLGIAGLLAGLAGMAMLGVTRDLCAEFDRQVGAAPGSRSPLGPVRLALVGVMAELIERIVGRYLQTSEPEELADFEERFRALAEAGLDPFHELVLRDRATFTSRWPSEPRPHCAGPEYGAIGPGLWDSVRFKRRRRPWPPLVRPRPIERAA